MNDERDAYPPDTGRYMSWAAIQFVHRASPRLLAWLCAGLFGSAALAAAVIPFIRVDLRVPASGAIAADPAALPAVAGREGWVAAELVTAGTAVAKGQPVAQLQTDLPPEQLSAIMAGLARNVARSQSCSTPAQARRLESAQALDDVPEAVLRDGAAALQDAERRFVQALDDHLPFEPALNQVVELSARLRGALSEYSERHLVRAPAAGTLLQYEVPARAAVAKGQVIAQVLPTEARLVARLTLDPGQAPMAAPGQSVRHRLEAYPYEQYGLFEGQVLSIEQGVDPQRGLFYVVRSSVALPPRLSPRLAARVRLLMGMKVQSHIIVGRRSLWDVLVEALLAKR